MRFSGGHAFSTNFHRILISWHCWGNYLQLLNYFRNLLCKRNLDFEISQGVYKNLKKFLFSLLNSLSLLPAHHENHAILGILKGPSNRNCQLSVVSCLFVRMLAVSCSSTLTQYYIIKYNSPPCLFWLYIPEIPHYLRKFTACVFCRSGDIADI